MYLWGQGEERFVFEAGKCEEAFENLLKSSLSFVDANEGSNEEKMERQQKGEVLCKL